MPSDAPAKLTLSEHPLNLDSLDAFWGCPLKVDISDAAWQRVDASRRVVERAVRSGRTHYGINTGFGHLKNIRISDGQLAELQENLVRSHAVGTGLAAPPEIVRWILLFKLQALLLGFSGIRRETVRLLADMLNADCLPVIPSQGSLGASGDLAPLAHMVLPMLGEGEVTLGAERRSAQIALEKLQLHPIKLQAKEGLALVNGTQYMSAIAASAVIRARRLYRHADIIGSMSLEACRGSVSPFDARMHEVRRHTGAQHVAANMRLLLADSEVMESHRDCDKIQDPYSLRCMAPVHGAARDAVEHAARIVEIEINSVTDNPILFDNGDVISGGNFHGESLALIMDYLAMALSELASISERRSYLLLSGHDGLPPMLVEDPGLNSGLMILQYTAAALVNENKVLCAPACVDTIPTSLGQEDHVSMGATSANKLLRIVDNAETVLAIEMMCAAQGLDFRAPLKAGRGAEAAHSEVSQVVPHAYRDRAFAGDMQSAVTLIRDRRLLDAVVQKIGRLH